MLFSLKYSSRPPLDSVSPGFRSPSSAATDHPFISNTGRCCFVYETRILLQEENQVIFVCVTERNEISVFAGVHIHLSSSVFEGSQVAQQCPLMLPPDRDHQVQRVLSSAAR